MFRTSISSFFRFRLALMLAIVAAAITGCHKGEPADPGGGGGVNQGSISMVLDGVNYNININTPGWTPFSITQEFMGLWIYTAGFGGQDGEAITINFGVIENEGQPSGAQFSSFFAIGPRPLAPEPFGMGASITYIDEDEEFWSTTCGEPQGTASITQIQSVSGPQGQQMVVTGTFAATLYNCMDPFADPMTISNGTFTLVYNNF